MAADQLSPKTAERLRKLLALAEQGVGGEKANAQRFLEKTLKAHGMTMADLVDGQQPKHEHCLQYSDKTDYQLLIQVLCCVLQTNSVSVGRWRKRKAISVDLTAAQHAEVVMHLAVARPALKTHLRLATSAFFLANHLVGPRDPEAGPSTLKPDELKRLARMVDSTERISVHKALPMRGQSTGAQR